METSRLTQVLLLAVLVSVVSGGTEDAFIMEDNAKLPILWNQATNAQVDFTPPGCKCVDTSSVCKFECGCECDVTAGQCDAGCCCDSECTAGEAMDFNQTAYDGCKNKEEINSYMCYDASNVQVNAPSYGMQTHSPLDGVMCVVYDNSPIKGTYFEYDSQPVPLPETFPASRLDDRDIKPEYSFGSQELTPNLEASRTHFTVGDRIQAAVEASGSAVPAFRGYWQLPTTGIDGRCSESNPVLFRKGVVNSNKCIRETSDIVNECALRGFNARKYTSDLLIVKTYKKIIERLTPLSIYAKIVPGNIRHLNADGSYTTISGLVVNGTGELPETVYDTTTGICKNALVAAHYHVTYSPPSTASGSETQVVGSGTITSITVDAVLTNISGTGAKVLEQEFLIDFISDSQPAESLASNNNHNASSRSGNPGYITGRPVLAGEYVKLAKDPNVVGSVDKYAIEQYSGGLRFPLVINGDGTCKESISDKAKEFGDQVLYGIDAKVGCSTSYTPSQLQTLCDKKSVPDQFNMSYSTLRVGIFGNANPYRIDQKSSWVPITVATAPTSSKYTDPERVCKDLITGVEYEFLVAKVGSYGAPQEKIVAARVVYKTSTIYLDQSGSNQNVYYTSSATFVTLEEGVGVPYVPDAPPLLPVLPYDVFYPFTQTRASSGYSIYVGGGKAIVLSMLASIVCIIFNAY